MINIALVYHGNTMSQGAKHVKIIFPLSDRLTYGSVDLKIQNKRREKRYAYCQTFSYEDTTLEVNYICNKLESEPSALLSTNEE
ncbi:unnamed protein product [Rhizophagus irregularis]|nr:unnamed protein product [Rhizophagus irregularis]